MFQTVEVEFRQRIERGPEIFSFRFSRPEGAEFRPGQFLELFLETPEGTLDHYFSFSSSPGDREYLEFTKRMSLSPYSRALRGLLPGAKARMKMPLGQFVYEGSPARVLFIAGGIGITPFRSICGYLAAERVSCDVRMIYCARDAAALAFREDFERFRAATGNPRACYLVGEGELPAAAEAERGRLDTEIIRRLVPDWAERTAFLCGPPGMVKGVRCLLEEELSLAPELIREEKLAGYAPNA